MNNEEMFLTILNRMDSMETGLNARIDNLDGRIDKLEDDMNLEFYAVREEMNMVYKLLKKEIAIQNNKVGRLMFIKDVEGYDRINDYCKNP